MPAADKPGSITSGARVALFLSVTIPIGFAGYAQHVRHTFGINGLSALAVLVALSLVIATAVVSSRE